MTWEALAAVFGGLGLAVTIGLAALGWLWRLSYRLGCLQTDVTVLKELAHNLNAALWAAAGIQVIPGRHSETERPEAH